MDGVPAVLRPAVSSVVPAIVLIEDHPLLRDGLVQLLTDAGFQVAASAGTCEDGHAAVTAQRPHLAVIDNNLPDGSGIELCRRLSLDAPTTGVIIHSGALSSREHAAALAAGARAVVAKSITGRVLIEAIHDLMRGPFIAPDGGGLAPDS